MSGVEGGGVGSSAGDNEGQSPVPIVSAMCAYIKKRSWFVELVTRRHAWEEWSRKHLLGNRTFVTSIL
jgi:hypothetical protein